MSGQFEKGREENNKIRHSSSTENQLHFIETNRTTRSYQHIENRTPYSTVSTNLTQWTQITKKES
jgi:hypothetical protein